MNFQIMLNFSERRQKDQRPLILALAQADAAYNLVRCLLKE